MGIGRSTLSNVVVRLWMIKHRNQTVNVHCFSIAYIETEILVCFLEQTCIAKEFMEILYWSHQLTSQLVCFDKVMEPSNKRFGPLEDLYGFCQIYDSKNFLQRSNFFAPQPSPNLLNPSFQDERKVSWIVHFFQPSTGNWSPEELILIGTLLHAVHQLDVESYFEAQQENTALILASISDWTW